MVEKTKKELEKAQNTIVIDGQPFVVPIVSDKKKFISCDVCGHANPEEASLCEMCSNYLRR